MKAILAALLLVSAVAHADVEFSKGGSRNVTTAADGADIIGQEAMALINSLNVRPTRTGGFLNYNISLNGSKPATGGFITCAVADTKSWRAQLLSAECFIGNVPKK